VQKWTKRIRIWGYHSSHDTESHCLVCNIYW
jgi:hypothetical protein